MIGVVIGRFQVPSLSDGHKYLIREVAKNCGHIVFLVGVPPVQLPTKRNPLPYISRGQMLQAYMHQMPVGATIRPLYDMQDNKAWVEQVDEMLSIYGKTKLALFGGRDSAIWTYSCYGGKHAVIEVPSPEPAAGTDIRAAQDIIDSHDFRAGVIWATNAQMKFPRINPCVDMVIFRDNEVLLARKADDPKHQWRLPGGHVEAGDISDEVAAAREAREETGLEVGNCRHVGSCKIDDWRYRGDVECIRSHVYAFDYVYGRAEASDDLHEVRWFNINDAPFHIMPAHRTPLMMAIDDRRQQNSAAVKREEECWLERT